MGPQIPFGQVCRRGAVAICAVAAIWVGAAAADPVTFAPPGGRIGYAATEMKLGTYPPGDAKACPEGFNSQGPRERFEAEFPEGSPRTVVGSELKTEGDLWFPDTVQDHFPFREAGGQVVFGLNLDGKTSPQDFSAPNGEPGVDNQAYRALGCTRDYADPKSDRIGPRPGDQYNRLMFEITGVSDLRNAKDVEVTLYRGLDPLQFDASGTAALPGGSETADLRWGKRYIRHLHGRIVDGVLTTDPADVLVPWSNFNMPGDVLFRAARFSLNLTPTGAQGVMAGYMDVEGWYRRDMRSVSTHHHSYRQYPTLSAYKALERLADGYPDPKTGHNTAISAVLLGRFTQVFVIQPAEAASTIPGAGGDR